MKTYTFFEKIEIAQLLPVLVIGVLALIFMSALIIDGGTLLANRRQAQNAADAAALAGARLYCDGSSEDDIEAAITQYVTENGATLVEWDISGDRVGDDADDLAGLVMGEVLVTTTIVQDSFFAKVMEEDFLNVKATAGAGCFLYQPSVVLPIAWSCRSPAAGSDSLECDILKLDYEDVANIADDYLPTFPIPDGVEPDPGDSDAISDALFASYATNIYIVMDSEFICGEDIECDLFEDGIDRNQLESGGNRGWLNLIASSSGTGWMLDLIYGTTTMNARVHTWFSGISGNRPPVYKALSTRLDEIVWIPVFNWVCDDLENGEPTEACMYGAHNDPNVGVPLPDGMEDFVVTGNPATPVYHVVAFAPFFPSCVHYAPASGGGGGGHCPGFTLAMSINPDIKQSFWKSINYFEGYFVDPETLPPSEDIAQGGADMGYYTISLTR